MLTQTDSAPSVVADAADERSLFPLLAALFSRSGKSPDSAARLAPDPAAGAPAYALVEHAATDRLAAERFITQCFARRFGARVDSFMPRLLTLRDPAGKVCGALGLRAANSRLFVEQYLDRPVEEMIARSVGAAVARHSIVEVGHFSGAFAGAMRAMIVLLVERLHREGYEWVVFAGTRSLRNAFVRMGLYPIALHAAGIERIPPGARAAWGTYYEHRPWVYAGRVGVGMRSLIARAPARASAAEPRA